MSSFTCSRVLTPQNTTEEPKGEKKSDQPPQAKKPKVKTKLLDLPIENSPQWQLADDMLNLFVENEVSHYLAVVYMHNKWKIGLV